SQRSTSPLLAVREDVQENGRPPGRTRPSATPGTPAGGGPSPASPPGRPGRIEESLLPKHLGLPRQYRVNRNWNRWAVAGDEPVSSVAVESLVMKACVAASTLVPGNLLFRCEVEAGRRLL